jgi:glutathione S-transferase
MADDLVFYTNPQSRGRIVRWMLEETGADYRTELVDYASTMKSEAYLAINPMGKVPAIVHGGKVVTECAAICHFLAEMHPGAGLLPQDEEMADYFRWLFFAAGPVEQAITARNFGFDPADPQQQGTAGFGSFERVMTTLERHVAGGEFVCGERFTMADVYVGSTVDWGLNFGILPPNVAFVAYAERLREREAYREAKAIDNDLIERSRK